jgi:hypothetical protein
MRCPVDSLVQISIVLKKHIESVKSEDVGRVHTENHIRRLSTKLERHVLQVALRGRFHNLAAHKSAARECNFVYMHVGADRRPDSVAVAHQDVHDARWKAGLLDELSHTQRRQRGELGRLDDNRVACGKRRSDFPREHQHCEKENCEMPNAERVGAHEESSRV